MDSRFLTLETLPNWPNECCTNLSLQEVLVKNDNTVLILEKPCVFSVLFYKTMQNHTLQKCLETCAAKTLL